MAWAMAASAKTAAGATPCAGIASRIAAAAVSGTTARSTHTMRRICTPAIALAVNIGMTRPPMTVTNTATSPAAASRQRSASRGAPASSPA